jgi:hypothetical protein
MNFALPRIIAARHGGVEPKAANQRAFSSFGRQFGVGWRCEGVERGVTVYDDFATLTPPRYPHDPWKELRAKVVSARILGGPGAAFEPR